MQACNFFKTLHSESTYKKTVSAAPHGRILFLMASFLLPSFYPWRLHFFSLERDLCLIVCLLFK